MQQASVDRGFDLSSLSVDVALFGQPLTTFPVINILQPFLLQDGEGPLTPLNSFQNLRGVRSAWLISFFLSGWPQQVVQSFNHLSLELPDVANATLGVSSLLERYMGTEQVTKSCDGCSEANAIHTASHRVSRLPQ
eukprot:scaffold326690_cov49-Prasinocladus_malaysianus.AAC.1